jgi:two-component system, NtrC family, sensor kinase
MTLRTKVIHIVLAIIVLYAGIEYGVITHLVYPGFVTLEQKNAEQDIERCKEALDREVSHLNSVCHDWAAWDATWEFAGDHNSEFVRLNLAPGTFSNMKINMLVICDTAGAVVWGEVHDPQADTAISVPEIPAQSFDRHHPLFDLPYANKLLSDVVLGGLFVTSAGPMLVSSRPILTNMNEGPVRGVFIIGQFLTDTYRQTLVEQTKVNFRWWTTTDSTISPEGRAALAAMDADTHTYLNPRSEETLESYSTFTDIEQRPALLLRADVPRTITAEGRVTARFALISALIAGVVVLSALLLMLRRMIVDPVTALTNHVVRIRKSANLSQRINPHTSDEIGTLGREFDQMIGELATARNRLAEQSFQSGQAEMAAGTLHNIRNALTPVVWQIDDMRTEASRIPADNLEQALRESSVDATPDDRRVALTQFICATADTMVPFVRTVKEGAESLSASIQQIEQMLGRWEEISYTDRMVEQVQLGHVIAEAVNAVPRETIPAVTIAIGDLSHLPSVPAERLTLVHVISAVINRAATSVGSINRHHSGRIDISGAVETIDGKTCSHLTIADNGAGLTEPMLRSVFDRDSAEPDALNSSHSLHWCANTLTAMGSRMTVTSDGLGKGSAVHMYFPKAAEMSQGIAVPAHPETEAES